MKIAKKLFFALAALAAAAMLILIAAAEETPTSGVITGNGVRLRSGPGTQYDILTQYSKGKLLTVLEPGDDWVKVKDASRTGYVSKDYFTYLKQNDNTDGSSIVSYAKSFLGVPYVWGGESPDGFDCSGFVQYVFDHFGITLPRTASTQYNATSGSQISKSELEPGDLVFFRSPSVKSVEHVGIYIGDGKFIHANSPGGSVRITALSTSYYTKYYKFSTKVIK